MRGGAWTLVCAALPPFHGWTTRALELGTAEDEGGGWGRLAGEAGVTPDRLIRLRQVHGNAVVEAGGNPAREAPEGDALISRDPRLLLTVRAADCVPVLIADRSSGAVAAVHAGWRGTSAGIARHAVGALVRRFGSRPEDLAAALGPSIGPCCYETGPAVRAALGEAGWAPEATERWFEGPEGRHLNLWRANYEQLAAAGLGRESVFVSGLCTACHPDWFHSYRRDGVRAGRLAGYIRADSAAS